MEQGATKGKDSGDRNPAALSRVITARAKFRLQLREFRIANDQMDQAWERARTGGQAIRHFTTASQRSLHALRATESSLKFLVLAEIAMLDKLAG